MHWLCHIWTNSDSFAHSFFQQLSPSGKPIQEKLSLLTRFVSSQRPRRRKAKNTARRKNALKRGNVQRRRNMPKRKQKQKRKRRKKAKVVKDREWFLQITECQHGCKWSWVKSTMCETNE